MSMLTMQKMIKFYLKVLLWRAGFIILSFRHFPSSNLLTFINYLDITFLCSLIAISLQYVSIFVLLFCFYLLLYAKLERRITNIIKNPCVWWSSIRGVFRKAVLRRCLKTVNYLPLNYLSSFVNISYDPRYTLG